VLRRRDLLAAALGLAALPPGLRAALLPDRLVVAGGALTEIVVALGCAPRLVGVDTTSLYPAKVVGSLPRIGYIRTLSAEGILSLNPSFLLASDQAGPPAVIDQLRAVKLPLALVEETFAADYVPAKVMKVAEALGQETAGKAMAETIAADLASVRAAVAGLAKPSVLFVLSNTGDRLMAGGQATAAETMIGLSGARNAIQGYTSYKPLSAEAALAANPDILVFPDHVVTALGGRAAIANLPQVSATRAAASGRIVSMDSLYLLGLGPRIAHAAHDFATALHPGARLPALPARAWTVA